MKGVTPQLQWAVENLLARYVQALDDDRLEEWPLLFSERCSYKIVSAENHARGLPIALIFADSRGMLVDRVSALREANIYESQRYRHIVSSTLIEPIEEHILSATSSFMVTRTMQSGESMLFATGRYLDRIRLNEAGEACFEEKLVICDSRRIDTLLAIPL